MKITALAILLFAVTLSGQTDKSSDVILRSMKDELQRSRTLALPGLETPYFIEYTLEDVYAFNTSASLGGTLGTTENRARVPHVRLRVGDYKFDNSNYILSGGSRSGNSAPLDDNYLALRREWWLGTDGAYKRALEVIARKRAALKNITQPEAFPDMWAAPAVQKLVPTRSHNPNAKEWTERIRSLSATFLAYPEITSSNVRYSDTNSTTYLVNSEGTVIRKPEPLTHFTAQVSAFTPDGVTVHDGFSLPTTTGAPPSDADLKKRLVAIAENVRALAKAPAGESYTGPVLFEGVAGSQVIAELLAPNFVASRRPVSDPGRPLPFVPSEFENRLEARILPEFLDVVDDPTISEWNGQRLIGSYPTDDEGVVPKAVTLVQKGRLKSFLTTRQPVKGASESNGHARLPGGFGAASASVSNLLVRSSESAKGDALRAQFLKLLTDRSKPWGIIVRKMDFPSTAGAEEARRIIQASQGTGSVRPVSAPVLAYKVYPDGREELVRGLRFRGLSVRSLREILAVSEETFTLDYLNNQMPFAMVGAGGYVATVSVAAPSLLFEELELEKPQDDVPKLPVVPPPPISSLR